MTGLLQPPMTASETAWRRAAEAVRAYHEAEGRFPPYSYQGTQGAKLGVWLNNQRAYSREGSRRALAPHRRAWLDTHLPDWDEKGYAPVPWEEALARYSEHVNETGRMTPKRGARVGGVRVYEWRVSQLAKLKSGDLQPERKAALDQHVPGWEKNQRNGDQAARARSERWTAKLAQYAAHVQSTGNALPEPGTPLSRWRAQQLSQLRKGLLLPERKAELDERVPGWAARGRVGVPVDAARWNRALDQYAAYVNRAGKVHPDAGVRSDGGPLLASWRAEQLKQLRNGRLLPERKAALDDKVPGWAGDPHALRRAAQ